jgi:hypothetical protein
MSGAPSAWLMADQIDEVGKRIAAIEDEILTWHEGNMRVRAWPPFLTSG